MVKWLCGNPNRLPILLAIYFIAHVLVRTFVSGTLDYDESEQAFLSQFFQLGYNSQPPLYTWLQRGTFETIGYSVVSLALLKNIFIWLTYVLVFEAIRQATGKVQLGLVASLGMLLIPQVSWESHRDLSHTVAAMFATSLLIYCVVMMAKSVSVGVATRWYVLLGFTVGIGALFKYNFALVVLGILISAVSVTRYRKAVLDWRLLLSISITLVMVMPHLVWMTQNFGLASTKTVNTLTGGQSEVWITNVSKGLVSLSVSILACIVGPVLMFALGLGRNRPSRVMDRDLGSLEIETRYLLERFFIVILFILVMMVVLGQAVEFENRWLQPFIFLVPAWLTLTYSSLLLEQPRFQRNLCRLSIGVMAVILFIIILRPFTASYRGKYTRLNVPYPMAAEMIYEQEGDAPRLIFTRDMRDAGNLLIRFPDRLILCEEASHLIGQSNRIRLSTDSKVWAFTASGSTEGLSDFGVHIRSVLNLPVERTFPIQQLSVPYLHGKNGDAKTFWFSAISLDTDAVAADQIMLQPSRFDQASSGQSEVR